MLELIVLGVVQGLTEFLPVSSTAHLLFAEHYLGMMRPGLVLEAVLHLGTAIAAAVLFWPDVVRLAGALHRVVRRPGLLGASPPDPYVRMAGAIAVATLVTAALGFGLAGPLESMYSSVRATAWQLLATGAILLWHRERGARDADDVTLLEGGALGLAQAFAIVPGISRSGVTIVAGIALGLRRTESARLSFLMAIPSILGASLFALKDIGDAGNMGYTPAQLAAGGTVSGVVGALAILLLVGIVRRRRLVVFTAYCWIAGAIVLATVR